MTSPAWSNAVSAMPEGPFVQDLSRSVSNSQTVESAQLWLLNFASDYLGGRHSPWPAYDLFIDDFEALDRIWPMFQASMILVSSQADETTLPALAKFMVERLPQQWDREITETCAKPVTVALRLADRIDHLTSLFAVRAKVTGSKDPYALRRAAKEVLAHICIPIGRQINGGNDNEG